MFSYTAKWGISSPKYHHRLYKYGDTTRKLCHDRFLTSYVTDTNDQAARRFFGSEASYLIIKYLYGLNSAFYDHPNMPKGGSWARTSVRGLRDVKVRRDWHITYPVIYKSKERGFI
jgi:hypothetical protein